MIKQLKRELSSERRRKDDEEKSHQSLRDMYRKTTPRKVKVLTKNPIKTNDDDNNDESHLDGETTVYHKDDPFFASTPRDHSSVRGRNQNSDSHALRHELEEQLKDDNDDINDESLLNEQKTKLNRSSLPPTPKRRTNTKFHSSVTSSFDGTRPTTIQIDTITQKEGNFNIIFSEHRSLQLLGERINTFSRLGEV
jgi:hypothetical protein